MIGSLLNQRHRSVEHGGDRDPNDDGDQLRQRREKEGVGLDLEPGGDGIFIVMRLKHGASDFSV
jgi:hypothetical protein